MLKILNKNICIPYSLYVADSFFSRLIGLLGSADFESGRILYFPKCTLLHTFALTFPIDIVFVNRAHCITDTFYNRRPWLIIRSSHPHSNAIELPVGTIPIYGLAIGDQLQITVDNNHSPRLLGGILVLISALIFTLIILAVGALIYMTIQ